MPLEETTEDLLRDAGRVQMARMLLQQKVKRRQQLEVMSRNMAFNHFARTTVINQLSNRKPKAGKTERAIPDINTSDLSIINLNTTAGCQTSQRGVSQMEESYRQQ